MRKQTILILMILLFIPFCFAVKPIQTTENTLTGLNIIYPKFDFFPLNTNSKLHFHVYNSTFFLLKNTTTSCNLHLYNSTGNHIFETYIPFDSNEMEFYFDLNTTYSQHKGNYGLLIYCNNSREAGFVSESFTIGYEPESSGFPLGIIILVPMLLALMLLIGSFFLGEEHTALKIFLFVLSFIPFFISMNYGLVVLIKYFNFPILENLVSSHVYWITLFLFVLIVYFIIYWIWKIVEFMAERKKNSLEY